MNPRHVERARQHLKRSWHEATFMQGAQSPSAKHLFDAISTALRLIDNAPTTGVSRGVGMTRSSNMVMVPDEGGRASFTPGPWNLHSGYLIRKCDDEVCAPIAEMRAPYRHGIGLVKGEQEQWHNARLIAASPTMAEYIQRKADEGDTEAQAIMETVHARS